MYRLTTTTCNYRRMYMYGESWYHQRSLTHHSQFSRLGIQCPTLVHVMLIGSGLMGGCLSDFSCLASVLCTCFSCTCIYFQDITHYSSLRVSIVEPLQAVLTDASDSFTWTVTVMGEVFTQCTCTLQKPFLLLSFCSASIFVVTPA